MGFKLRGRKGFTVLETLVAMVITSGLLILVSYSVTAFRAHNPVAERAFWRALAADWKRSQYEARYRHHSTVVTILRGGEIRFVCDGLVRTLEMPRTLTVTKTTVVSMKGDGYVQPRTIQFHSTSGWQYKMIIQMGWGVYRLEKAAP
ncbi:type II secretion system protein [Secundilactobacillus kimchicus]|uniref:type II secretion system protein n=1 Tax=Secundilactobacillus kimchicus TaxID=528209 RepID=UPI0024A9C45D|nr:type II secretion system protein [Secundilactobacillus kimchicus]